MLLSLLGAAAAALQAQPVSAGGRVGLASAWLERGLELGYEGAPVPFVGADVYLPDGWSIGASALRLRDRSGARTGAWIARAGRDFALDERWRLLLDLQYSGFERGSVLAGWRGTQLGLGIADGDRWSLTWNAEQTADPALAARSLDFNLRWPLTRRFGLSGGLGRVFSTPLQRYDYGQAGLEWHAGGWRAQLERSWVQPGAERSYGAMAGRRWVASAQWFF